MFTPFASGCRLAAWLCALWVAASLNACGQGQPPEPSDQDVARADRLRPADARLASLYERSCLTCHGTRSAAPLTGFAPAWAIRLEQGAQVVLAHARDGFKGMPARGLCNDCTDEDLQALITFMSQGQ